MSIVLAIEPDRRQAAHLTAIARQLVGAELVLADTTEGALDAIGNRVPDLVLVPALLSPQDDAALAAALRVIAAAAHVRTLTIPVLASGIKRAPEGGGMLAKWRKNRAASSEPEGCDPAVFGEQISAYLREAAAERAQIAEDELLNEEPIQAAPPVQSSDTDGGPEMPTPSFHADVAPAPDEQPWDDAAERTQSWEAAVEPTHSLAAAVEPTPAWVAAAEPTPWSAVAAEPSHLLAADPIEEPAIQTDEDPLIDLSEVLEGLSADESGETFDGEAVGVYTIAADGDAPELDPFDMAPEIPEPLEIAEQVAAALDPIAASANVAPEKPRVEPWFAESLRVNPDVAQPRTVEPPAPPRPDVDPWAPMYLTPGRIWPMIEGMPAETPAARTEQPDWIELVASLRQDLERRRTDPAPPVDLIPTRPSDGAGALRIVKKERAQPRKTKPVQDEWGFFDPERCGFSTLLAKLEEITEEGPAV
jgi:hypothetical protein